MEDGGAAPPPVSAGTGAAAAVEETRVIWVGKRHRSSIVPYQPKSPMNYAESVGQPGYKYAYINRGLHMLNWNI